MHSCDCCGGARWEPLFTENGIRLGTCPDCDLHSIEHIPEPEARMTEMEEGHYAGGSRAILDADRQIVAERVLTDRFQTYVDLATRHVDDGCWLDIGCGAGLLIALAQRAGFAAEGIELNASRAAAARHSGATVHEVPVEEVGYPDDCFDVISMINVFSHLTAPSRTLAEVRRILKPGGVLVLATGEITAGARREDMLSWNLGDHLHFLGDRTIDRYAESIGFAIVERSRTWLHDEMFSRDWLRLKGRDPRKNAIKTAVRLTPGGLALMRAVMLRRMRDSSAHSSVFALRPR